MDSDGEHLREFAMDKLRKNPPRGAGRDAESEANCQNIEQIILVQLSPTSLKYAYVELCSKSLRPPDSAHMTFPSSRSPAIRREWVPSLPRGMIFASLGLRRDSGLD